CSTGVRLLATSREPLNLPAEALWPVAPLSSVDLEALNHDGRDMVDDVRAAEAAQLFVDRAQLVLPSFAVTNLTAAAISRVTRQLDGLPLAIELAVSRLSVMSLDQLETGLNQRLRLLTSGYRTAANRHTSLRATLDWSYGLLSEAEKILLRRLAVFA